MNNKEYIKLKEDYYNMVTSIVREKGGLSPSITVIGVDKKDGKNAILYIGIEPEYMKDEESKDKFVDITIPKISERIREDFEIKAVVWASEAWLRELSKSATEIGEWKAVPIKKEVLIIVINSEKENETVVKEIVRKGKQVNAEGQLTDTIELVDIPEYNSGIVGEGRFTNLYKKFTEHA